jgi:hypothetical protein
MSELHTSRPDRRLSIADCRRSFFGLKNNTALQHFRAGKICAIPGGGQEKPVPEAADSYLLPPVSFIMWPDRGFRG